MRERDDTIQESTGKAKFTFAEGCTTKSKHTSWEVRSAFTSIAMMPLPWIGQVWGSQSKCLANGKGDIRRGFEDKEV
jgi:hypothetical protein